MAASWRSLLSQHLHELRIVYCASSPASKATRDFVAQNYAALKQHNPAFPIYVRTCEGVQPFVAARYDRGVYRVANTAAATSAAEVLKAVEQLVLSAEAVNAAVATKAPMRGAMKVKAK